MKQSVLVVDDTIENIDVLKAILSEDYIVKAATRGKVAIKIAEKSNPDIILLDIMMPEMNGYEVCEKLKQNPKTKHIPIIFVTAMSEEDDEAKGFECGAVDYVTKPINPIIVKARLKTHLALANQQRQLDIQVKEKTKELNDSRIDLVHRLGKAAEYKDNETGMHVVRVSKYSGLIAKELGLAEAEIELVELAAPMHDVGKIGIEDSILKKPGKLTDEEYNRMKDHSNIGVEILGSHNDRLLSAASIMAQDHHERWDGSGYPNNKEGEDIHLFARICSVADVFDALTSTRPYKKAWDFEEAFSFIIQQRGKHFDPSVIDAFEILHDEFYEVFINNQD